MSEESELETLSDGDDLFKDEEDKQHLMSIPEVERENILYERAEKRREARQRKTTLSSL
eukprot:CAMPEP_0171464496 /NCGR_PEP_ID=MMETSP0945-20130129/7794_1 /TAXON_ID=109269 /ORGANISM="Vaucheria litorea, Strain CCMP2940" /LENGTH=58 /DNA_ID=CAMNT_0011991601 /DNA_START=17 /DNA_END=189 /DNA_ORIENTATION=+